MNKLKQLDFIFWMAGACIAAWIIAVTFYWQILVFGIFIPDIFLTMIDEWKKLK